MNIWVTGVEHGESVYCIQLRLDTIKQTRYFRAVKLLYIYIFRHMLNKMTSNYSYMLND